MNPDAKVHGMGHVAAAFGMLGLMIKLRGRRLDRLYVESSKYRRWLTFTPYVAKSAKSVRR